jgi:hypothetical protein
MTDVRQTANKIYKWFAVKWDLIHNRQIKHYPRLINQVGLIFHQACCRKISPTDFSTFAVSPAVHMTDWVDTQVPILSFM